MYTACLNKGQILGHVRKGETQTIKEDRASFLKLLIAFPHYICISDTLRITCEPSKSEIGLPVVQRADLANKHARHEKIVRILTPPQRRSGRLPIMHHFTYPAGNEMRQSVIEKNGSVQSWISTSIFTLLIGDSAQPSLDRNLTC